MQAVGVKHAEEAKRERGSVFLIVKLIQLIRAMWVGRSARVRRGKRGRDRDSPKEVEL